MSIITTTFEALSQDPELIGLLGRNSLDPTLPAVYENWATDDAEMPYITTSYLIREGEHWAKRDCSVEFNIFTQQDSIRAEQIKNAIYKILDQKSIQDAEDGEIRYYTETDEQVDEPEPNVTHWKVVMSAFFWRSNFISTLPQPTAPRITDIQTVTFAGKAKGDGDSTRLIFYSATATTELAPTAVTTEVNAGYAGASVNGDGNVLTFQKTSGVNQRIQFVFSYSVIVNQLDNVVFRVRPVVGQPFTLRAWNFLDGAWERTVTYNGNTADMIEFTLTDLTNFIDATGKMYFSVLSPAYTAGTLNLSLDYVELVKTYYR